MPVSTMELPSFKIRVGSKRMQLAQQKDRYTTDSMTYIISDPHDVLAELVLRPVAMAELRFYHCLPSDLADLDPTSNSYQAKYAIMRDVLDRYPVSQVMSSLIYPSE
jgi:hypothetical protein